MKRLLAFVSAVAVCLCSISCAYAVEVNGSSSTAQVQEDIEWFCEEHQQPLIPDDELPEGYEQICLQCNPVNQIQTMAISNTVVPSIGSIAFSSSPTGPWTKASTVIGEGQRIYYYLPRLSPTGTYYLRFIFTRGVTLPGREFFYFSYGSDDSDSQMTSFYIGDSPNDLSIWDVSSRQLSITSVENISYQVGGSIYGIVSSNSIEQIYIQFTCDFDTSFVSPLYLGSFYFSSESQFEDDIPTEPPDDSISQSWLGGLFDTIFGGIQEIVSGIENLPQSIASGLQSLFDGVTNAVNSIGTAITGAVDAASSAISSAVDSASSAITGIIGQQWNDESGHNDEIDQAVSDLESQDQQMGQVEDQYLDDFNEQQSDMAGTVSAFQWPSGITSAMAWITIQMNTIWSGLGGSVQMLFTFSMILGLSLIFLGRWRA